MNQKPTIATTKKVNEFDFYTLYFELQNIGEPNTMRLSKQEITLASILCTNNFQLTTEKSQHGKSEKYELAKLMEAHYSNFQTPAIYGVLKNLRRKGILIADGHILELNPAIKNLKAGLSQMLKTSQQFSFNYLIEIEVTK